MCCRVRAFSVLLLCVMGGALPACGSGPEDAGGAEAAASAAPAPGGFLEPAGKNIRSRWSKDHFAQFVPKGRGSFTFPQPYRTQGVRLTAPADCGGNDCLSYVGYSYWRNMNNHVNSERMLILLAFDRAKGGAGPTLLSYNKLTEEVSVLGPLFDSTHRLSWSNAVGWYFSATLVSKLYINDGPRMLRYDVTAQEEETVFDVSDQFGTDRRIWQMYSSNDDRVHSATLRTASGDNLGCVVYFEPARQFRFFPKAGDYDECQVDKSGRYVVIFEQLDGKPGVDNRFIDLATGAEERVYQGPGAGAIGHHDTGFGYLVGHDSLNLLPNASLTRNLDPSLVQGPVNHMDYNWELVQAQHISHTNARPDVPKEQQYACGSNADRHAYAQNEILCFRLDGSLQQLVVAPVMTNLDASGGGTDYEKMPKGNLDVTGRYFIWTANLGGNRLEAFLVKVPGQLLERSGV